MGETRITFTSDDKDLVKSLERMQKEMVKLREEARKASQEGKKNSDDMLGSLTATLGPLAKIGAGYISINTALQLGNALLRERQQLEDKAARVRTSISDARQELIANMPGASGGDIRRMLDAAGTISRRSGINETFANQALSNALSASGGDPKVAANAAYIASRFLSHNPTAVPDFAGAMTDISRVTGSKDMTANLGFFGRVGATSRIFDPKLLAGSAPEAMIGMRSFGATAEEAASMFQALTTGAADKEGRISGTGAIALAKQLSDFFPEGGVAERIKGKGRDRKVIPGRPDVRGFTAQVKFLQEHPEVRQAFFDDSSFEKKVEGPIRTFLSDPNSPIAQQYAQELAAMPDEAGRRRLGAQMLRAKRIDPMFAAADLQRQAEVTGEHLVAGNAQAATDKAYREIVRNIHEAQLGGRFESFLESIDPEWGSSASWEQTARARVKIARGHLRSRRRIAEDAGDTKELGELEKQTAALEELVRKMEAIGSRKQVPLRQE